MTCRQLSDELLGVAVMGGGLGPCHNFCLPVFPGGVQEMCGNDPSGHGGVGLDDLRGLFPLNHLSGSVSISVPHLPALPQ